MQIELTTLSVSLIKSKENINTNISAISAHLKVAVSVDCVVLGYDGKKLKVLLIECNTDPYKGKLSLLGELVKEKETLDEAALRVLEYWTGQESLYLEEVKTFSKIERHPLERVITVAYYSLVEINKFKVIDSHHMNLKWVDVKKVKDLAFDHNEVLDECLSKLRTRLKLRPIGFNLLPKKFSLNQLQNLYEVILDTELDKRNFRRKILGLGILVDLKENQQEVAHRPAKLYAFNYEKYQSKIDEGFKFAM